MEEQQTPKKRKLDENNSNEIIVNETTIDDKIDKENDLLNLFKSIKLEDELICPICQQLIFRAVMVFYF
jgi:hypothetical protein